MPHHRRDLPPVETLRAKLAFDPETGILRWRRNGARAGFANERYRRIRLDGRRYFEHYVIWAMMTGIATRWTIYHANRDGLDNRWENLREGTLTEALLHQDIRSSNTSGAKGVQRCPRGWKATLMAAGKIYSAGPFATRAEAEEAYRAKVAEALVRMAAMRERASSAPAAARATSRSSAAASLADYAD